MESKGLSLEQRKNLFVVQLNNLIEANPGKRIAVVVPRELSSIALLVKSSDVELVEFPALSARDPLEVTRAIANQRDAAKQLELIKQADAFESWAWDKIRTAEGQMAALPKMVTRFEFFSGGRAELKAEMCETAVNQRVIAEIEAFFRARQGVFGCFDPLSIAERISSTAVELEQERMVNAAHQIDYSVFSHLLTERAQLAAVDRLCTNAATNSPPDSLLRELKIAALSTTVEAKLEALFLRREGVFKR